MRVRGSRFEGVPLSGPRVWQSWMNIRLERGTTETGKRAKHTAKCNVPVFLTFELSRKRWVAQYVEASYREDCVSFLYSWIRAYRGPTGLTICERGTCGSERRNATQYSPVAGVLLQRSCHDLAALGFPGRSEAECASHPDAGSSLLRWCGETEDAGALA